MGQEAPTSSPFSGSLWFMTGNQPPKEKNFSTVARHNAYKAS
jgi:hypothetical protein